MRWRRFMKWAKWVCTVAALLSLGVVVFSEYVSCERFSVVRRGTVFRSISLWGGLFWVTETADPAVVANYPGTTWHVRRGDSWYWGYSGEMGGSVSGWYWRAGVLYERSATDMQYGVSVLYPAILTTVPAALLWYADRRRFGAGSCGKCGYDRRGLAADMKCPECGAVPGAGSVRGGGG